MKNLFLVILLSASTSIFAQESKKLIKDVSVGAILGTVASTSFPKNGKPFTLGHNLFAVTSIKTAKTIHNVFYGFANNSLNILNAYFLKKNWDVYFVYSRTLDTKGNYLGGGIEKMEKIGGVKFFLFSELGTTFQEKPLLSFGFLINTSWSIRKR